jgi:hypothetical protein
MGKPNANTADQARMVQTISAVATARYPFSVPVIGSFNVAISGTFVATLSFSNSFDGGTTWVPVSGATLGTTATFTAPTQFAAVEFEPGVLWAVDSTYTSGTAVVRLSN